MVVKDSFAVQSTMKLVVAVSSRMDGVNVETRGTLTDFSREVENNMMEEGNVVFLKFSI